MSVRQSILPKRPEMLLQGQIKSLSTLPVLALLVGWRQQSAGYWWRQMQPSCGGDGHRWGTFTSAQNRDHVLVYLKGLSPQ